MPTTREAAAHARSQAVRARGDRPNERRNHEHPGAGPRVLSRARIEIRSGASGNGLDFEGYASVTNHNYEMYDLFGPYDEQVASGAFTNTLNRADLDVPLVLGHDSMRRIARTTNGTLSLEETDEGLLSRAPSLDAGDADVAYIAPKIRSGLIDEMSFRFSITRGEWSPDWTQFNILEVDIHRGDVSIVGYGANPATSAQLRSISSKLQGGQDLDPTDTSILMRTLSLVDPTVAVADLGSARGTGENTMPNSVATMLIDELRAREAEIAEELRRRGQQRAMTFADLLAVDL